MGELLMYENIDSENSITSWYSPAHNALFKDLGYGNFINQSYTKIRMESPIAINSTTYNQYTYAQYWGLPQVMKTKLATSNVFRMEYPPYSDIINIYIGGVDVPMYTFPISDHRYFAIQMAPPDGFLWISYLPISVDNVVGNKIGLLSGDRRIPEHITPSPSIDNIVRARMVLNKIEEYIEIRPNSWIGGTDNRIKAKANSLVPNVSPIHLSHLAELQTAIARAEYFIDMKVTHIVPKYTFSSISVNDNYNVTYIEEILEAVNLVEDMVLTYL
jgi:hypothetical protein